MIGSVISETSASNRRPAVAGVPVTLNCLAEAVGEAVARLRRGEGFTLFALNLDHIVKMRWSAAFRAAYRRATFVCADSWPAAWLASRGGALREGQVMRTAGADLVEPLCEVAARRGFPIFLVGPGRGVQSAAIATLRRRFRGLRIVGAEAPDPVAGDPAFDAVALAGRIRARGAKLCFLCLSSPKQELLADALATLCPGVGIVCAGAALDFIAELTPRAPEWMQRRGLDGLWRLGIEPRRLAADAAASAYILVRLGLGLRVVPPEESL